MFGLARAKHYSAFYPPFSRAPWDPLDAIGHILFKLLRFVPGDTLFLPGGETLAGRTLWNINAGIRDTSNYVSLCP